VKSSKAQITAKFHKIPMLRFEDQQLTSFSGLLVFQLLFKRIDLKDSVEKMFWAFNDFANFRPSPDCDADHYSPAYRVSTAAGGRLLSG
jgi:hypothetical protein